jgi:dTDP-4-dehydrorhamnose 3,5-epimerase
MRFMPTALPGAWLIEVERHEDERGFFARTWCRREFEALGLDAELAQCSISHTLRRGTLRGLHWQADPHAETKLIRCTQGVIWDVIVDLRGGSTTYRQHYAVELSADNCRALYVPKGFAHGFVTLADHTQVLYCMSAFHEPAAARGARWDDPAFAIPWPVPHPMMNPRDANYPDFPAEGS